MIVFSLAPAGSDVITVAGLSSQELRQRIIQHAMTFLGVNYLYGGTTRRGVDCSGLTYATYLAVTGVTIPRNVRGQATYGTSVTLDQAQPGDIMIFDTMGGPSHAGIYLGDRKVLHAAYGVQNGVIVSGMDERYYATRFLYARRVIKTTQNQPISPPVPPPVEAVETPVHPLGITLGPRLMITRDRVPMKTGTGAEFIITSRLETDDWEILYFRGDFETGRYSLIGEPKRVRLATNTPLTLPVLLAEKAGETYGAAVRSVTGELKALYIVRAQDTP